MVNQIAERKLHLCDLHNHTWLLGSNGECSSVCDNKFVTVLVLYKMSLGVPLQSWLALASRF
jgi:hypothetical protein